MKAIQQLLSEFKEDTFWHPQMDITIGFYTFCTVMGITKKVTVL